MAPFFLGNKRVDKMEYQNVFIAPQKEFPAINQQALMLI